MGIPREGHKEVLCVGFISQTSTHLIFEHVQYRNSNCTQRQEVQLRVYQVFHQESESASARTSSSTETKKTKLQTNTNE